MGACLDSLFEGRDRIFWIIDFVSSMGDYLRPTVVVQASRGERRYRNWLETEKRYFFFSLFSFFFFLAGEFYGHISTKQDGRYKSNDSLGYLAWILIKSGIGAACH